MTAENITPKPNALARAPQKSDVQMLLESRRDAMLALAPKHLNVDRLIKVALLARNKKKELLAASGESLLKVLMQSAELGLELEGPQGHAYAVPFKGELVLVVGYKGMIELVRRSGLVQRIEAHLIHKNDKYKVRFGLDPVLEHEPLLEGDPGPVIAAYAVAKLKDGSDMMEVMTLAQLEVIKARSQGSKRADSPWHTDTGEMQRKTVIRRICKFLPQSTELAQALDADDQLEARGASLDVVPDFVDHGAPAPAGSSRTEKLKSKVKAAAQGAPTIDGQTGEPAPDAPPPSAPSAEEQAAIIEAEARGAEVLNGAPADAVFPNYGKSKGEPVSGASRADLEFYAKGCRKSLADPEKSRWHDKERALLAAIEAELSVCDDEDEDDSRPDDDVPF